MYEYMGGNIIIFYSCDGFLVHVDVFSVDDLSVCISFFADDFRWRDAGVYCVARNGESALLGEYGLGFLRMVSF